MERRGVAVAVVPTGVGAAGLAAAAALVTREAATGAAGATGARVSLTDGALPDAMTGAVRRSGAADTCAGAGGVIVDGGSGAAGCAGMGAAGVYGRWGVARPARGAAAAVTAPSEAGVTATGSVPPEIEMTPPHTEQRARTPVAGTFAGSTRKTERQSGHETVMVRDLHCAARSAHATSEFPTC